MSTFVLGVVTGLALVALGSWIGERLQESATDAVADDTPQLQRFEERLAVQREVAAGCWSDWT